jgi:hypothetical protein
MHDYLTLPEGIDVILEHLDGRRYSFKECGIGVRDFVVSSPYYSTQYESLEGMDGQLDLGTTLGYRQIKMKLYFVTDSVENYANKRDEVFSVLDSRQPFYVTESRNPHKRWKVKIDGIFEPDQNRIFGFFDVALVSASPYAQSLGTTLNPTEYFQVKTNESVQYIFSTNKFQVWNDGDALINPRNMALKIEFQGASNNLIIRNITNGSEWKYTGSSTGGDTITLDGVRSLKNGVSIFGNTNRKLLTLNKGWNDFEIIGTSGSYTISFEFPFYYI